MKKITASMLIRLEVIHLTMEEWSNLLEDEDWCQKNTECMCMYYMLIHRYVYQKDAWRRKSREEKHGWLRSRKRMESQTQNCFHHPFFILHPLLHPFLILLSILTISTLLSNFSMRYKSIGGEKRKKIEKNVFYYHYFSLKESYAKRWYEITSLVRIRSSFSLLCNKTSFSILVYKPREDRFKKQEK